MTPSSSQAPEPSVSFSSGMPNSSTARTPSRETSSASAARSSTERRPSAGSSAFGSVAGPTNNGRTKSSRSSRVSRTSARSRSLRRSRRIRVRGNELTRRSRQNVAAKWSAVKLERVACSHQQSTRSHPGEPAEDRAQRDQPEALAQHLGPGAEVVQRRAEEAHRMRERQQVAQPAGGRNDLSRDQAEEDDRHHHQQGDQRGRASLARECSEQRPERAERAARQQQADHEQRQPPPG